MNENRVKEDVSAIRSELVDGPVDDEGFIQLVEERLSQIPLR